jgi:hypothetical protein
MTPLDKKKSNGRTEMAMRNYRGYEIEMSQTKAEERGPGIFTPVYARVLNCIAAVLLMALLAAGIVYRVFSWFGVVMILVLFLLHTICRVVIPSFTGKEQPPRLHRTIVLLLWTLFLAFLAVILFWPGNDTWRTYTFEAELAALESRRAIPDAENAATLYGRTWAFTDFEAIRRIILQDCTYHPAVRFCREPGDPKVVALLDDHAGVLRNLTKASQIEQCHFPVQVEPFADIESELSERHEKFRLSSCLLLLAAEQDIGNGRTETALEKCRCVIQMARHYSRQSTVMGFLDGFSMERWALILIDQLFMDIDITEKSLKLLAESIDVDNHWSEDWPQVLAVEKLRAKNLCGAFYEVNPQGKVRFSRRFHTAFPRNSPGYDLSLDWTGRIGDRVAPLGLALTVPWSPETAGKAIDDMYEDYYIATDRGFDQHNVKEHEQLRLTHMQRLGGMRFFLPSVCMIDATEWPRFHVLYMGQLTRRRACVIAIGLRRYKERYGHWPVALEHIRFLIPAKAFVDPRNGNSFDYMLTNGTYRLYSKGINNLDWSGLGKGQVPRKEGIQAATISSRAFPVGGDSSGQMQQTLEIEK